MAITYSSANQEVTITGYKQTFSIDSTWIVTSTLTGFRVEIDYSYFPKTPDGRDLEGRPFKIVSGTGAGQYGIISATIERYQLIPPFGPKFPGHIIFEGDFPTLPDSTSVFHLGYSVRDIQAEAVANSWAFCSTEGDLFLENTFLTIGDGTTSTIFGGIENITMLSTSEPESGVCLIKVKDKTYIAFGSERNALSISSKGLSLGYGSYPEFVYNYSFFQNADGDAAGYNPSTNSDALMRLENVSFSSPFLFQENDYASNVVFESETYANKCNFGGSLTIGNDNVSITNSQFNYSIKIFNPPLVFDKNVQGNSPTSIYFKNAVTTEISNVDFKSTENIFGFMANGTGGVTIDLTDCTYFDIPADTQYTTLEDIDLNDDSTSGTISLGTNNSNFGFEKKTVDFSILDSDTGNPIENVRVYIKNNASTNVYEELSSSEGKTTPGKISILRIFDVVSYNPITQHVRKYGYFYFKEVKVLKNKSTSNLRLQPNTFITQSNQATVDAYTGISVNDSTGVVTLTSNHSIQELYDYLQSWGTKQNNIQYDEILTTLNGEDFQMNYDLVLNGGNLTGTGFIDLGSNTYTPNSNSSDLTIKDVNGTATNLTLTGLPDNTEVRVYSVSDGTEFAGIENTSGGSVSFPYVHSSDISVNIILLNLEYVPSKIEGITLTANGLNLPVSLRRDRNYLNP